MKRSCEEDEVPQVIKKPPQMKAFNAEFGPSNIQSPFVHPDWRSSVVFYNILGMTKGTDLNQRVAQRVVVHGVRVMFSIALDTEALPSSTYSPMPFSVRVLLVCDRASNGEMSDPTQVMDSTNNSMRTLYSSRNASFLDRFYVMKEEVIDWNPQTFVQTNIGSPVVQTNIAIGMKKTIKWVCEYPKGVHIKFDGNNTGTYASVLRNNMFIMALVNDFTFTGTELQNVPYIVGTTRVYYKD